MPHTVEGFGNVESNDPTLTKGIDGMRPLVSDKGEKVSCGPTMTETILAVIDQRMRF